MRFVRQRHASPQGAPLLDKSVITRVVTVAGGRFAPGHLGELTQQVPFERVDAVLEQTCVDGMIMTVADSTANLAVYSKQKGGADGGGSYPQLRLLALVSCAPAPSLTPSSGRQRRDHLCRGPGPLPARGDAPARRPELRLRAPGQENHRDQGGLPDPRPHRERRPEAFAVRCQRLVAYQRLRPTAHQRDDLRASPGPGSGCHSSTRTRPGSTRSVPAKKRATCSPAR